MGLPRRLSWLIPLPLVAAVTVAVVVAGWHGLSHLRDLAVATPSPQLERAAEELRRDLIAAAAGLAALFAAMGWWLARRIAAPLTRLREGAERLGPGAGAALPHSSLAEVDALSATLNAMADRFSGRIDQLERQRLRLESLLEGMAEGIVAVDARGVVVSMNRAAAALLGRGAAAGRGSRTLPPGHPLHAFAARVLASPAPVEAQVESGVAGAAPLLASGVRLGDADGGRVALVVVRDSSRVGRARRSYIANLSHELKTPIAAIQGYAELLLSAGASAPETAQALETIRRQADRLNALISDIIFLARLEQETEAGGPALDEVVLGDLLQEAVAEARERAEAAGVRVVVGEAPDRAFAASGRQLAKALRNLIDNALAASKPGDVVTVGGEAGDDEVRIHVSDQGACIPPEQLPFAFERFGRVETPSGSRGTGLRLTIVREVALAHGGSVSVQSRPGAGCVFSMRLPATAGRP